MRSLHLLLVWLPLFAFAAAEDPAASADPSADAIDATAERVDDAATAAEPAAELTGRARYNAGLQALAAGNPSDAADAFLGARDSAGPDPELRYRAAYNLGIALANQADELASEPAQAIAKLRQSAAWFNDAVRLAPADDQDARINLEIVMRRILELADQLNEGKHLEARLDRLIDDQRGTRDQIRRLMIEIAAAGVGAVPVSFERQFESLAARERVLLAEASAVAELAADERQNIATKGGDAVSDQERIRAMQLENLDGYLQQARQSLSDTRRRLRRLDGERAHRRADGALAELKRAREQLADPITVLKAVVRDQTAVLNHTGVLAESTMPSVTEDENAAPPTAPPWLTAAHLAARQENAAARTGETLFRLKAGVEDASDEGEDPAARRLQQAVREAIPILEDGLGAMRNTIVLLPEEKWAQAVLEELQAIDALNRAIERFAGLRDLIELAYADQTRLVDWLSPAGEGGPRPGGDALAESGSILVADNLDRLARLEGLLSDELAATTVPQAAPDADPEEADTVAAERQRYELAEALRAQAVAALQEADTALPGGADAALAPATAARGHLEELRRLFFSIVEHLHELLAAQTDTHDETASTFSMQAEALPATLGTVAERQSEHATVAGAIAAALANQADAAEGQAPQGVDLAGAVEEVQSARGRMQSASVGVADAAERASAMSPVLEPILDDQNTAMTHLETAIRLLQPPNDRQQGDDGAQQQRQQAAQAAEQDAERMSERQALARLQAIRDRDAERRREREAEAAQREPVEKDW